MINPADQISTKVGAVALFIAGGLFFAFLPFFTRLQSEAGNLTQTEAGALGSAYLLGFTIISFTALWWISRVNWRFAIIAAAISTVLGLFFMQGAQSLITVIFSVVLIGFAMGGLWAIAYRLLGATSNPDRSFAFGSAMSYGTLGVVAYVMATYVIKSSGLEGAAILLSVLVVLLVIIALGIPKTLRAEGAAVQNISYRPPLNVSLALLGILLTGFSFSIIWVFAETIGLEAGFTKEAIGPVISFNLLAIAAGSLIAFFFGASLGRGGGLVMGFAIMVFAIIMLMTGVQFWAFAIGISSLGLGIGIVLPFQMATLAFFDTEGRFLVLIAAAQGFGTAMGPVLGGIAADSAGFLALMILALVMLVAGSVAFLLIRNKR